MGTFEYTLFLILSFLTSLLMVVMAVRVFSLKSSPVTRIFGSLLIAISLWAFAIGGGMLSTSPHMAFNWIILRMAGVLAVPTLWLVFAHHFTHRQEKIRAWHAWLLGFIPLATFILVITSAHHQLLIVAIDYVQVDGYWVDADWQIGPLFWVHMIYSFLLVLIGNVILLRHAWRWSKQYRKQAVILTLATILPLFTNAALTFNFFPSIKGNYDVVGFAVAAGLLTWGLFAEQILDLTPIAHQILVEHMPDALFVFDEEQRLVDVNPAGLAFLDKPLSQVMAHQPSALFDPPIVLSLEESTLTYAPKTGTGLKWFQVHNLPLIHNNLIIGNLLTLRDITRQQQLMNELRQLATTDSLTGLANRRHFMDQSIQYLHHAQRYSHDLSLLMIDIDHFKAINDQFGHGVGDQILTKLAEVLAQNIRSVDILSRYGGEEFCLLLPETPLEAAHPMAERLRWLVKETNFTVDGIPHRISVSVGVASLQAEKISMDTLINRADQAMYHAKRNGRDQVIVWNSATNPPEAS
ncbi:MAG: diguanylate cyclase [Anaerolineae bacterium]|nr:diguanylate cyclase [Anaerolineae bacterium]